MRRTALILATVAALGTAVVSAPAEARYYGRGWGWGPGIGLGHRRRRPDGRSHRRVAALYYGPGYGYYGPRYRRAYYGYGYGRAPMPTAPATDTARAITAGRQNLNDW